MTTFTISFIAAMLLTLFVIDFGTTVWVMGRLLNDDEMVPFLDAKLGEYHLNPYFWKEGHTLLSAGNFELPYIAKVSGMKILTKWYIQDYGTVPRWSRAHKMIEKKVLELKATMPVAPKKKLTDLLKAE